MMEENVAANKPILSGHEKFVFRHGWLKKGVDAARGSPHIFSGDQALVDLGVGKNMVRSIRHWCLASGLLTENGARSDGLTPTLLADKLFASDGWDPYTEDTATLWLLHWQLTANPTRGIIWRAVFGHYYEPEFTKRQLQSHVARFLERSNINAKESTVEQAVDICLRTYVPAQRSKPGTIAEDTFDSPLADLDLVRYIAEDGIYRFNIGPKNALSPHIFAFALLSYASGVIRQRRTLSVEDCIYQPGSPGQVFKRVRPRILARIKKGT